MSSLVGILDDLVKALAPRFMRLTAKWYVRGGIFTTVTVQHLKRGFKPASMPDMPLLEPAAPAR